MLHSTNSSPCPFFRTGLLLKGLGGGGGHNSFSPLCYMGAESESGMMEGWGQNQSIGKLGLLHAECENVSMRSRFIWEVHKDLEKTSQ